MQNLLLVGKLHQSFHTLGLDQVSSSLCQTKRPPQLEKIPLPPQLKFGPYQRKRWYFVPKSNYKVRIFPNFKPPLPLFWQNAEPHR